jgi:hypothetical protein
MDSDSIFLRADEELVVMTETPYEKEAILQQALAEYPDVIAGPTTTAGDAGRLLLVRREMGVPGAADGPSVWSLDHLFVDGDGVPVIVEVKRSSDTRIRREVVGQMLDYAANGSKYWPVATLRQFASDTAAAIGVDDPVTQLWPETDVEEFWRKVQTNLDAGRVRLLFVADRIPVELARIIEFLNEQMSPAEVLGVELRQYVGGQHIAYVPRVIGQTARAQEAKTVGGSGQVWSGQTMMEVARQRRSVAEVELVELLLADVDKRGIRHGWGKGVTAGVSGWYQVVGQPGAVWNLNIGGETPASRAYMYFYLADLVARAPDRIERAADLLARIPAMKPKIDDARASAWKKYPSVYLPDVVADAAYVASIFEAITTLVDGTGQGAARASGHAG